MTETTAAQTDAERTIQWIRDSITAAGLDHAPAANLQHAVPVVAAVYDTTITEIITEEGKKPIEKSRSGRVLDISITRKNKPAVKLGRFRLSEEEFEFAVVDKKLLLTLTPQKRTFAWSDWFGEAEITFSATGASFLGDILLSSDGSPLGWEWEGTARDS